LPPPQLHVCSFVRLAPGLELDAETAKNNIEKLKWKHHMRTPTPSPLRLLSDDATLRWTPTAPHCLGYQHLLWLHGSQLLLPQLSRSPRELNHSRTL
jgi:hypothetical protein